MVQQTGGNQPRGVGDVGHEQGPDFVSDATKARIIPIPGIGRRPANDELGLHFFGFLGHPIPIDAPGFLFHSVEMRLVKFTRIIDR